MDFNALFSQFAPQLQGMPSAAPTNGPVPMPGMDTMPMPTTQAPVPGMGAAMPQQQPKLGGKEMILQLAPMLISAFMGGKNPHASAAFMQGYMRSQEAARAQSLDLAERERERQEKAAAYMQRVAADAAQFESPEEHAAYLQFAEKVGAPLGIKPGTLVGSVAFPKTKAAAAKRTAAQKKLQQLEASQNYREIIGTPAEEKLRVTMDDGSTMTVPELRALAGLALTDAAGKQVTPPAAAKTAPNLTDYEGFLARFAKGKGKKVEDLTAEDEVQARKMWGQADDRPPQPRAEPVVIIQTVDANGQPVTKVVPRSEAAGQTFAAAPPKPNATQQGQIAELQSGLDAIQNIRTMYKPEFVGPVAGRANRMRASVPGMELPDGVADFYAAVAGLRNEIIKMMSGAAVSGSEEARMKAQLPSELDKPEVFQAKLRQTEQNRANLLSRLQRKGPVQGAAPAGGPRVGERRMFNGKVGEWDGKGWKAVQ